VSQKFPILLELRWVASLFFHMLVRVFPDSF